ncbi:unnamed protein product [Boreogadus saida]
MEMGSPGRQLAKSRPMISVDMRGLVAGGGNGGAGDGLFHSSTRHEKGGNRTQGVRSGQLMMTRGDSRGGGGAGAIICGRVTDDAVTADCFLSPMAARSPSVNTRRITVRPG